MRAIVNATFGRPKVAWRIATGFATLPGDLWQLGFCRARPPRRAALRSVPSEKKIGGGGEDFGDKKEASRERERPESSSAAVAKSGVILRPTAHGVRLLP